MIFIWADTPGPSSLGKISTGETLFSACLIDLFYILPLLLNKTLMLYYCIRTAVLFILLNEQERRKMAKTYDYLFKLLLIGDSGVGKTCVLFRSVLLSLL